MKKFDTVFRGYDKNQVHECIDRIINSYEDLLTKSKMTDDENQKLREKVIHYSKIEDTLNRAIFTAESASDQIKKLARKEAESLIDEARRNSNRIINDALMKAEKVQANADLLNRNVNVFKRRLKTIIENQLEVIEEIDRLDLRSIDRDDI